MILVQTVYLLRILKSLKALKVLKRILWVLRKTSKLTDQPGCLRFLYRAHERWCLIWPMVNFASLCRELSHGQMATCNFCRLVACHLQTLSMRSRLCLEARGRLLPLVYLLALSQGLQQQSRVELQILNLSVERLSMLIKSMALLQLLQLFVERAPLFL